MQSETYPGELLAALGPASDERPPAVRAVEDVDERSGLESLSLQALMLDRGSHDPPLVLDRIAGDSTIDALEAPLASVFLAFAVKQERRISKFAALFRVLTWLTCTATTATLE